MTNIEKKQLIKRENLDETYYFQAVLEEAYRLNLLTDSEIENIQLESIQLLARQTERYTGGESSSIKVETAQSISQSIFYTIGIYLKSFSDTNLIISALKQKPLLDLYQCGKELIEIEFDKAQQLLNLIQKNYIVTDNYAYNDTIQNGIPMFFSTYDVEFAAHDTPGSIDYPLSINKTDSVGIEYISRYLEKLYFENQFCKNFTNHDIDSLLRGYDERYQDLLINIFKLILTNVIGCILSGKNNYELNITSLDRQYLYQKLLNQPKNQLDKLLLTAVNQLCQKFNISEMTLKKYITATVMEISAELKNTVKNNRLDSLFITLKKDNPPTLLHFEDGEKLDDELFKNIADEIRDCRFVSDKLAILKREIHSITDLVDILEGYCIFDDEFTELFQTLGDMELALLLKKLPTHLIDAEFHITENEKEWYDKLSCFLKEMDITRRKKIRDLSEKIGPLKN